MIKKEFFFNYQKLIKKNFIKYKNKIFIESNDKSITYGQFFKECKKFSNYLKINTRGLSPIVAIYETKEIFDYISIIGTLLAGGICPNK